MVIPCSTQAKEGSWFAKFNHKSKEMVACLHQAKVIDYRRLHNSMGNIDDKDFGDIKTAFKKLY